MRPRALLVLLTSRGTAVATAVTTAVTTAVAATTLLLPAPAGQAALPVWLPAETPVSPAVGAPGVDVTCASTSLCVAAYADPTGRPQALRWSPAGGWVREAVPRYGLPAIVTGSSCTGSGTCVVVGATSSTQSRPAASLRSPSGTWRSIAPAAERRTHGLYDVSCTAASFCMAVGGAGPLAGQTSSTLRNYALRWDGSRWEPVPVPTPRGADGQPAGVLTAVSCASASYCLAVALSTRSGLQPYAMRWDGRAWTGAGWPAGSGSQLPLLTVLENHVSCIAPGACTVTGLGVVGDQLRPYFGRLTGTRWALQAPPTGTFAVHDVSCPTAGTCFASGVTTQGAQAVMAWAGGAWSSEAFLGPLAGGTLGLSRVACVRGTDTCAATGVRDGAAPVATALRR